MAIKRIDENPNVTDTIIFDLQTTDVNNCLSDPYQITQINIYFLERDFASGAADQKYDLSLNRDDLLAQYAAAQAALCLNPASESAQSQLLFIQNQLTATSQTFTFYYKNALPIATFGDTLSPAWSQGMVNPGVALPDEFISPYPILHIDGDSNNNPQYGQFELQWTPIGAREGDYFICWSWNPCADGTNLSCVTLSSHMVFSLSNNTQLTTSIPTHYTKKNKYPTLFDRYLPEMFKNFVMPNDLTPQVLMEFNNAVGDGFVVLEDLVNQMVDLTDANVVQEAFLPWLADLFGLVLRSHDPTLWRRQIKGAIPTYKQKGTLQGLTNALSAAGISLTNFVQYWQVVSPYTWQESFKYTGNPTFALAKACTNTNQSGYLYSQDPNFELYYQLPANIVDTSPIDTNDPTVGEDPNIVNWVPLALAGTHTIGNFFDIATVNGVTQITWKSSNKHKLSIGEEIRIIYQYTSNVNQTIENEIRTLPLGDLSDRLSEDLPPKNWNVRVIDESNTYFDQIIAIRNPWANYVIFGQVRTEFPYSENIYNMEEYNGSTRDSTSPCHINKNFIDDCSGGLSSFYRVDLEIDQISDDRVNEAIAIIDEYTPFHAVLHTLGFTGNLMDFTVSPIEEIQAFINATNIDTTITNSNLIFTHGMTGGSIQSIGSQNEGYLATALRSELSGLALATRSSGTSGSGTVKSRSINLYAQNVRLDQFPAAIAQATMAGNPTTGVNPVLLEIPSLSISVSDNISINQASICSAVVNNITDAKFTALPFIFRLSTQVYAYGGAKFTKLAGNQALIDVTGDTNISDIRKIIRTGDYLYYGGTQYLINQMNGPLVPFATGQFIISGWTGGNITGATITIYRRLLDNQYGNFYHSGTILDTGSSNPITLANLAYANTTLNNKPIETNNYKENYLVSIGGNMYTIDSIGVNDNTGEVMVLNGPNQNWTLNGSTQNYTVYQYTAQSVKVANQNDVPGYNFALDGPTGNLNPRGMTRKGNDIIDLNIIYQASTGQQPYASFASLAPLFDAANNNQIMDATGVAEEINFTIERRDE